MALVERVESTELKDIPRRKICGGRQPPPLSNITRRMTVSLLMTQDPKGCAFVNCDVIGFIALDKILGLFLGGVAGVALECHVGNDFVHDSATNPACFRIP